MSDENQVFPIKNKVHLLSLFLTHSSEFKHPKMAILPLYRKEDI